MKLWDDCDKADDRRVCIADLKKTRGCIKKPTGCDFNKITDYCSKDQDKDACFSKIRKDNFCGSCSETKLKKRCEKRTWQDESECVEQLKVEGGCIPPKVDLAEDECDSMKLWDDCDKADDRRVCIADLKKTRGCIKKPTGCDFNKITDYCSKDQDKDACFSKIRKDNFCGSCSETKLKKRCEKRTWQDETECVKQLKVEGGCIAA